MDFPFVIGCSRGTTSNVVGDSAVINPFFLSIACLSRDFSGLGDSTFGTTSNVVGDSEVGTPSFPATPCSNVGLVEYI